MVSNNPDVTRTQLKSLIHIDNGVLVWAVAFPPHIEIGDPVGTVMADGKRRQASIKGVRKQVSHISWFFHYGVWPDPAMVIDHIDHDPSNNRIENLREVTSKKNSNHRRSSTNRARQDVYLHTTDGEEFYLGKHFPEERKAVIAGALAMLQLCYDKWN